MLINGIQIGDRYNRPNAEKALALRALFYNDGVLVDPVEIVGAAIFPKSANMFPNTVLNDSGIVSYDKIPTLNISVSSNAGLVTSTLGVEFSSTNFGAGSNASIYRLGVGDYAATVPVNKLGLIVSGAYGTPLHSQYTFLDFYDGNHEVSDLNDLITSGLATIKVFPTSAVLNSPQEYVDIWTVKMFAGSQYQTFVNEFTIYNDSVVMMGEPPIVNITSKLINKHVQLGEKINLTISNEVSISNKAISDSIKNVVKGSSIVNPSIEIRKMNEYPAAWGSYVVSSFSNTSGTTSTTGDDSVVFSWDTAALQAIQAANTSYFDNVRGTYGIRMKCDILNETKITPLFYLNLS